MRKNVSTVPIQILVDFYDCPSSVLLSEEKLFEAFSETEKFFSVALLKPEKISPDFFPLSFSQSLFSAWIYPKKKWVLISLFLDMPIQVHSFLRSLKQKLHASHYLTMEIPRGRTLLINQN